jgi:hypothetical protein
MCKYVRDGSLPHPCSGCVKGQERKSVPLRNIWFYTHLGTKKSASKDRMSKDRSMTMSLSFARPITLAMRNATPVPIIPKSHKLQKSVSVRSVSRFAEDMHTNYGKRIGAKSGKALSKNMKKQSISKDHERPNSPDGNTYDRRGRPHL